MCLHFVEQIKVHFSNCCCLQYSIPNLSLERNEYLTYLSVVNCDELSSLVEEE